MLLDKTDRESTGTHCCKEDGMEMHCDYGNACSYDIGMRSLVGLRTGFERCVERTERLVSMRRRGR